MQNFGIIGNPVKYSLSPVFHPMIYDAVGFSGSYGRFLVLPEDVKNVPAAMKTLGIRGLNVTSPYKSDIMPYIDELSPEAAEIGAVNTVLLRDDGTTVGYNTDGYGFAESLLHAGIEIKGKSFAVMGISGAGRAVCWGLEKYGASNVTGVSTKPEKGISYAELETLTGMDVIVNCTTVGMSPDIDMSPVNPEVLANFKAAVDLIYSPAETQFLKDAGKSGLKTLNGLPMLVLQGIRSFKLWTGIEADREISCKIINNLACILAKNNI